MERKRFLKILIEIKKICDEENQKLNENEEQAGFSYEVLQFSDIAQRWDCIYNVSDFYNHNWLGNKDFMHIPTFKQVLSNCLQYPVIIARKKDSDEILGISTIKYDENTSDSIDPYYPIEEAKYFSITGILVKKNSPYKGIGKKIYEIAIKGAYEYNKAYPGTQLMCVIDCRNGHSLGALSSAVSNINDSEYVGTNCELPANIIGYYELRDKVNDNLCEAPTLVLGIGLDGIKKEKLDTEENAFDYKGEADKDLFESLKDELRMKLMKYRISSPVVIDDADCGMVYYYPLDEECRIQGLKINPNGTEKGNDRIPFDDKFRNSFVGPIVSVYVEKEVGEDR